MYQLLSVWKSPYESEVIILNEIKLSSFPSNYKQALAILYLQNQDLKGKTPTDLYQMYHKTMDEIDSIDEQENALSTEF